jgi:hypothetical protein
LIIAKSTLLANFLFTPLGDKKPTSNLLAKDTAGAASIKNKMKRNLKIHLPLDMQNKSDYA